MDDHLLTRYSRHIMLDAIGFEGQSKLSSASILQIGLGGLGSPAAIYLAASGVGRLICCDDDTVELTNLQRQILYDTDSIGNDKASAAKKHLSAINPHCLASAHCCRVDENNVDDLVSEADVVIDASDNFSTRHIVNRACVRHKKPLVFAAAVGLDAQISVFDVRRSDSPCYNCLFSEEDAADDTPCALLGVLAPFVGMIGCLQAVEAIRLIAMPTTTGLVGRLLLWDALQMRIRDIIALRDPSCRVCHER